MRIAAAIVVVLVALTAAASAGDIECTICEFVVNYVEHQNVPNATYEELEAEVQAACNELPSPYGAACNNTVQNFLEPIVDELEADTPPAQVCSAKPIMLCSSSGAALSPPAAADDDDFVCTVCELAVKLVEGLGIDNATFEEAEMMIQESCDHFPGPSQAECNHTLHTLIEPVFEELSEGKSPQDVCSTAPIEVCASTLVPAPEAAVVRSLGDPACTYCEMAVKWIEGLGLTNATLEEAEMMVQQECDRLPKQYQAECNNTLQNMVEPIFQEMVDGKSPEDVCSTAPINVCSSTGAVSTVSKPEASIECQACEVIIMYAERIGNNATYEEIMTELQQVCDMLPANEAKVCNETLTNYVDPVLEELEAGASPDTVCSSPPVELCKSAAVVDVPVVSRANRKRGRKARL